MIGRTYHYRIDIITAKYLTKISVRCAIFIAAFLMHEIKSLFAMVTIYVTDCQHLRIRLTHKPAQVVLRSVITHPDKTESYSIACGNFTFSPQRGEEFATVLLNPVAIGTIAYLAGAGWDSGLLTRLMVRQLNQVHDYEGEFEQAAQLISKLQQGHQLFFGIRERSQIVTGPLPLQKVTASEVINAAKEGLWFEQLSQDGPYFLMRRLDQPMLYLKGRSEQAGELAQLLSLGKEEGYFDLEPGPPVKGLRNWDNSSGILMVTHSPIGALLKMAGGVKLPKAHLDKGIVASHWAPQQSDAATPGLVIKSSSSRPSQRLAVSYRDHWYYIADDDLRSREIFMVFAELFRLAFNPGVNQNVPILTLPVGG